jgi:hypothetical protein
MRKKEKRWEAQIIRPIIPGGWDVLEQRGCSRYEETSWVRWGKKHHLGESERFWIVLCEFNPEHWANKNMSYRYTVRGGRHTKPSEDLRYFQNKKQALDYIMYLAESTNAWLNEVNSPETIAKYDKRIAEIKKLVAKQSQED